MKLCAGLDEAGRGPLAGPVSAACVILPSDLDTSDLKDSKVLSEKKREKLFSLICETCCWGHAFVDHTEIDAVNILNASLLAMKRAYEDMLLKLPQWCVAQGILFEDIELTAIADGNKVPDIPDCTAVVKADATVPCVSAASIIAKVKRDRLMVEYDALYPGYGYAQHKGYPTKAHKEACRKLGPSPIQRHSFTY